MPKAYFPSAKPIFHSCIHVLLSMLIYVNGCCILLKSYKLMKLMNRIIDLRTTLSSGAGSFVKYCFKVLLNYADKVLLVQNVVFR